MDIFPQLISKLTNIAEQSVKATIALLDEGCTIPFISRYRKERTGNLNEIQIAQIADQYERLKEIQKRKDTIIKSISDQDKLTADLEKRIKSVWNLTELEDIYLPFKPKRHTRAEIARHKGLEPLATIIRLQREPHPESTAQRFVKGDVADAAARFVLVNLQGNYNEPELVGEVQNQDLHATGPTDYVIIVPASGKLTEQAERLAQAHREASGMRVLVVRADAVFN